MRRNPRVSLAVGAGLLALTAGAALPLAQQDRPNPAAASSPSTSNPPEQPLIVVTENQRRLRIVPLARGLSHPWGMALLPDGRTILVTERPGRLRIVRDGVLDRMPVAGVPTVNPTFIGGLERRRAPSGLFDAISWSTCRTRRTASAASRSPWRAAASMAAP